MSAPDDGHRGTIFEKTRTPVGVWFVAAWQLGIAKNGLSARTLAQTLGVHYRMVWAMLQCFRVAMVRAEREPLSGDVEVDETFVGEVDHGGKRGRGARKCIVVVALEPHVPKGFGRVRLRHVLDASADSLVPFVCETVAPGSVMLTDAWGGFNDLARHPYTHKEVSLSASPDPAHVVMPGGHRVASLFKRWVGQPTADYPADIVNAGAWVAERAGDLADFLVLCVRDDHLLVHNVAVGSDVQRSGTGKRLLDLAEERA